MRLCIVTPYDLSHEGGVNRHAQELARALRGAGHHARVLGPASGAVPEGCDGVPGVVPVPANGSVARIGLLQSARATRDYLAAGRFDLVHVHEPIVPGPGRHALRLARVPVVATFHASAERELPLQRALRAVAAAGLGRIDAAIAVSRAAKAFSRAIYRGRTAVIPNGVDLSRFSTAPTRGRARAPGAPRVLFVGRFGEPRKGLSVLLDAVALLRAQGRLVEVDVVGDGAPERFRRRAERLGVFFRGRLSDAALARAYAAADLFCAPSLGGESFGMVLVEAMAAGCPVVASDLPGYAEAARGAALLTPAGDPGALAVAIWRAVADPELRERLAQRGRARAAALCWSRVAARVLLVYAQAAAREAQPGAALLLEAAR
ncbi:glycosyltransferase family 4 protein [Anaeromyxobacter sp. Fw109-5]|uniref:glycosyltransferase family 4 protein n=1 Tax=Anaeromyxobacter sp. (strain Fw109-5) TaxID=404589 RepID=UPI0000ED6CA5|nr:glycosyltransferase family 4 protein [Anaeromyxobacter sp. Fw109-5]ABS28468.1 Phosphatidylinositol alpha-mannosyltransferase [Anaeromyxobacter sp. Fw109-5]